MKETRKTIRQAVEADEAFGISRFAFWTALPIWMPPTPMRGYYYEVGTNGGDVR